MLGVIYNYTAQILKKEAESCSETLVTIYQLTWYVIAENLNPHVQNLGI